MTKYPLEQSTHKAKLEDEFNTKGHPKADLIYEIAWDIGHAYGYNAVRDSYMDLVELIR